jgi:hypothetical protein
VFRTEVNQLSRLGQLGQFTAFAFLLSAFCSLLCPTVSALVFSDNFDYAVGRNDTSAVQTFQSHGWNWAKTEQTASANGYLYTVASIPGYTGPFPGGGSRVLAIEALPGTFGGQTDFYLQYGSENAPANTIPGNVWFQYWIYVNHFGTQLSQIGSRDKFLYPCNGSYPCNTGKWIHQIGADTNNPHGATPLGVPSNGDFWLASRDNQVGTVTYTQSSAGDQNKMGQQNIGTWVRSNTWTLVKLHWNTSASNVSWEAWLTPQGQPTVKVVEWISGVTPGFTWTIPPEHIGGHRVLRMPTTFPGPNNSEFYDSWIYMDDFVISETEADLPVYSGGPPPPPAGSACDLNADSSTNVSDVQLCANQAIGVIGCTTGDINHDLSCNVVDVQRVVNAALGGQCVTQ